MPSVTTTKKEFEKRSFHSLTRTKTRLLNQECCPKSYFVLCVCCCCTATQNLQPALECDWVHGMDHWSEGMICWHDMENVKNTSFYATLITQLVGLTKAHLLKSHGPTLLVKLPLLSHIT